MATSGVLVFHVKYLTPVTRLSFYVSILHFCLLPGHWTSRVLNVFAFLTRPRAQLGFECFCYGRDFSNSYIRLRVSGIAVFIMLGGELPVLLAFDFLILWHKTLSVYSLGRNSDLTLRRKEWGA